MRGRPCAGPGAGTGRLISQLAANTDGGHEGDPPTDAGALITSAPQVWRTRLGAAGGGATTAEFQQIENNPQSWNPNENLAFGML